MLQISRLFQNYNGGCYIIEILRNFEQFLWDLEISRLFQNGNGGCYIIENYDFADFRNFANHSTFLKLQRGMLYYWDFVKFRGILMGFVNPSAFQNHNGGFYMIEIVRNFEQSLEILEISQLF